jgi:hypothetical protein
MAAGTEGGGGLLVAVAGLLASHSVTKAVQTPQEQEREGRWSSVMQQQAVPPGQPMAQEMVTLTTVGGARSLLGTKAAEQASMVVKRRKRNCSPLGSAAEAVLAVTSSGRGEEGAGGPPGPVR